MENKMKLLTGIKDVDREILMKLDDRKLLLTCSLNKYTFHTVCDDNFFYNRIRKNYPGAINSKNMKWKQFYLLLVKYVDKMQREFGYVFKYGDPVRQYEILKNYGSLVGIEVAARENYADLVNYFVKLQDSDAIDFDYVLSQGAANNNKEIIEIALKQGATDFNIALYLAAKNQHKELIDFFLNKGANINSGLEGAVESGNRNLIDYFISLMKENEIDWNKAIRGAIRGNQTDLFFELVEKSENLPDFLNLASVAGNLKIIKYLVENRGFNDFDSVMFLFIRKPPKNAEEILDYFQSQGYDGFRDWREHSERINSPILELLKKY